MTQSYQTEAESILRSLSSDDAEIDNALYDYIGMFRSGDKPALLQEMRDGKLGWESHLFKQYYSENVLQRVRDRFKPKVEKGAYACKMCKSRKTYFSSAVTRALDEPMTVFINCQNCSATYAL